MKPHFTPHCECSNPAKLISVELIKRLTAEWFQISIQDLDSPKRPEHIAWPRQVAMALTFQLAVRNASATGREFHKKHQTVLWAIKRVSDRCETEPNTKRSIEELRNRILIQGAGVYAI